MPRRRTDSRTTSATDAAQLPRSRFPPLEEDIEGRLRRLEEKRSSRPPPPLPGAARAVPFEQLLRDFVSEISRKRGTAPP